jgi:nucleoside 2-deoxyribosyltransferase
MMPFSAEFSQVYEGIKGACQQVGYRCLRADNIWEESTIIQDIFNLIFRSYIVIVDFTGKNPNVMYETGIAHTLGKHVIPLTQSANDVPFDLRHHRFLPYLNNYEGIETMTIKLTERIKQLGLL